MKTIRICFVDWSVLTNHYNDPEHNPFLQILNKRYNVIIDNINPQYVFFSVIGEEHLKYKNCIKIFYTGECISPNFNHCEVAFTFCR